MVGDGPRALCMALHGGFLKEVPRFASDAGSTWVYGGHIWIASKPPVLVAILMGSQAPFPSAMVLPSPDLGAAE